MSRAAFAKTKPSKAVRVSVSQYILLFGSVMLGGWLGSSFPALRGKYLHLGLSLSGAFLLSITALHLIPEAFGSGGDYLGLALLGGFFVQIVLEQFSGGVEHGHVHVHEGSKMALPVLVGLSVHALLEGSPLALADHADHAGHNHDHLLWGIALHKLPAGFALSVLLIKAGYTIRTVWILLLVFASMSPLGAFLAGELVPVIAVPYLLAAVTGSLLHVSTTILFELDEPHHHRISWQKTAAIALGIAIAIATTYG